MFMFFWVRATFPRFRYDQLMRLGWKVFLPLSLGWMVLTAGALAFRAQIQALGRGVDILVATPGRLLDHMDSRRVNLSATEVVVLDEADHMLDLGFIVPIRKIVAKLPKVRQTLFFSATMPREIATLANEMLNAPIRVEVTPVATTAERIAQQAYLIEASGKRALLIDVLSRPEVNRALVFTRTKRGADRVTEYLETAKIAAGAIHGNKSQNTRQRTLNDFKAGRTKVLVATDIAARGIDVDGITHVVNFELPEVPETYVHRIGRTARAGAEGIAISFCDNSERGLLRDIEKVTRQEIPTEDKRDPSRRNMPEEKPAPRRQQQRPQGQRPQGQRPNNGPRKEGDRKPGEPRATHRPAGQRADQPSRPASAGPGRQRRRRSNAGGTAH